MNHVVQNLTNDIVMVLLRGPLHTRAIADLLGRSHATVIRKLQDMIAENVADFTIEGKNKVYFLKRSLEGRNAAITAELSRQSGLIAQYPQFRGIVRAVLDMQDVRLALVFGSYAKGTSHEKSDVDLYILTEDRTVKRGLEDRFSILSVKTGPFDTENPMIREIIKDHIIIKGVEDYFEKTKFFA
jgi:predicted nucleotidyltransferase